MKSRTFEIIIFCAALFFAVLMIETWPFGNDDKEYPIEVETSYTISYNCYSTTMECDSVKGDTIYKDGISIVNKNIVNVTFK